MNPREPDAAAPPEGPPITLERSDQPLAPETPGEAVSPTDPALLRTAVAPEEEASPTPHRRTRFWPRVLLLLVVFGILVAFRAILMPFALAIFFAFIIHPIVRLLERIPLGRNQVPRWLAVILIYLALFASLFTVVPRITVRIASDLGALGDTLPSMFGALQRWQGEFNDKVASLLAVNSLPLATENQIRTSLRELQDGSLATETRWVEPGRLLLQGEGLANGALAEGVSIATATPVGFSLFTIQVNLPGGERPPQEIDASKSPDSLPEQPDPEDREADAPATPSPASEEPNSEEPNSEEPNSEEQAASLAGGLGGASSEETARFSDEQSAAFLKEWEASIQEELKKEGLSQKAPQKAAAMVLALNEQHLGLPPDDPALLAFAQVVEGQVYTATRQEEYAGVVENTLQKGLTNARVWLTEQLQRSTGVVTALVAGTFDFFLILMLAAFFLMSYTRMRDYVAGLVPPQYRGDYAAVLGRIDTRLSGAIRGQVIICFLNGFQAYIGFYCIGWATAPLLAQYAAVLGVLAAILSLIPIFGIILATIPAVLLALTQSVFAAVAVVIWTAIMNMLESYLLNPNILGRNAQMNPIIVIFALLAGRHVGGLSGALVAVPIASVLVALFGYYRRRMAHMYATEAGLELTDDPWDD